MDLVFEQGSRDEPKGHALIYFRSTQDEAEVLASYLVVPPVPLNLARYIPPLFAANLPTSEVASVSAVPLPPLPEKVESYAYLQRLAETRADDLIYCGVLNPADVQRGLLAVGEAGQHYLQLYNDFSQRLPPPVAAEEQLLQVSDVLYSLMGERQRLAELAKLTGKLRYAVQGGDATLVGETVREMEALGRYVPEKYRVGELIAAAQIAGQKGDRLSQLYIDRCYRLAEEDYGSLQKIDEEIRSLES